MPRSAPEGRPTDLEALAERFAAHRRSRPGRGRLPDQLWEQAAKLAGRHGINRVHLVLRLNYYDLKRRVEVLTAMRPSAVRPSRPIPRPTFVELGLGPPLLSAGTLLEIEDRSGRKLTVRLAAEHGGELIPLARAVWGCAP